MQVPITISEEEFDGLPFGIIQIDCEGRVLRYNAFESELSGMTPESVKGRNFFHEIAPCTDVSGFRGRFEEAKGEPVINLQFAFVFPFARGERRVFIHILAGPNETFWIFVSESSSERNITKLLSRSAKGL